MTEKSIAQKAVEKLEAMSDEEREEFNKNLQEAFDQPIISPELARQNNACQCCYCKSQRGVWLGG